jgi:hypothetical protein
MSRKKRKHYYENFKSLSVKIPWDDWIYILQNYYGFEMIKKSGSERLFIKGEIRFTAHKPHKKGDKFVHKSDRKRANREIEKLETKD